MNKIIKIGLIALLILALLIVSGCTSTESTERKDTKMVNENLEEMSRQVGMPKIDNFFEKKTAKAIFELRDNSKLVTFAYMTNLEGKFIYLGKCIGYGLPYSVQYTNPEKLVNRYGKNPGDSSYAYDFVTIPQADPNGLYMPEGLSATWLMLINEETGETEVIYAEPEIVVTQSKLPRRLVAAWSLPGDY